MAEPFAIGLELDDANAHIEQAKSHIFGNAYLLDRAMQSQVDIFYMQLGLEDVKLEGLRVLEVYEESGALHDTRI